ncbi:MAG: hypothetical protein M0R80_26510 [Proteobacteria bacterium]|jgi:hypothetical protein|nr:hypothetical protein [Pseudomonadota bacterium]
MNSHADFFYSLQVAVEAREGTPQGREILFRCPYPGHTDASPSASFHPVTSEFFCPVCQKGGGPLQLAALLGLKLPPGIASRVGKRTLSGLWAYRDADGEVLGYEARYD